MKHTYLVLAMFIAGLLGLNVQAMEAPQQPHFADVTFINTTKKRMIIIPVWKDASRSTIPMELPDESLLEPGKPARVTLKNENLNDLEMYYLTYHPESRSKTGLVKRPSELKILAKDIEAELKNKSMHHAQIEIQKGRLWFGKTYGFAIPAITALSAENEGPAPVTARFAASLSPAQEKEKLYQELGVAPTATPYEILKMERPVKGLSGAEGGQYIAAFLTTLNVHAKELLTKYDPSNFDNKVDDVMKEMLLGIHDFNRKMYSIILAAKQEIAKDVKAL